MDTVAEKARRQFYTIVGLWFGIALVLSYLALNVYVSYTAYHEAYDRNVADQKLAQEMWRDFCSTPTWRTWPKHGVAYLEQMLKEVNDKYGHDCDWASPMKDGDMVLKSIEEADRPWFINFARRFGGPLEPRTMVLVLGFAHLCLLFAPLCAGYTWFRAVRLRTEMMRKRHDYTPTLAEQLSVKNIVAEDRKHD